MSWAEKMSAREKSRSKALQKKPKGCTCHCMCMHTDVLSWLCSENQLQPFLHSHRPQMTSSFSQLQPSLSSHNRCSTPCVLACPSPHFSRARTEVIILLPKTSPPALNPRLPPPSSLPLSLVGLQPWDRNFPPILCCSHNALPPSPHSRSSHLIQLPSAY